MISIEIVDPKNDQTMIIQPCDCASVDISADKRAELDGRVGLLTEYELIRPLALNFAIARHVGGSSE